MWQSNTSPTIRAQQVVQKGIAVNIVLSLIKFADGFSGAQPDKVIQQIKATATTLDGVLSIPKCMTFSLTLSL